MTLTVNGEKNPETLQLCVFGHGSMAIGYVFCFWRMHSCKYQICQSLYYTSYSNIWGQ